MNPSDWPALPFAEWEKTCDTLHMWTQIVGKTRMALTPLENHWWNVPLYVTPRGLSTSAIPWKNGSFSMEFDLVAHQFLFHGSGGVQHCMRLFPRSVADFYAEYMASLKSLGIEVQIYKVPVEFDDVTPFDQDQHHASYDTEYVERFRRILIHADRVFKQFRSRFLGKSSPVHFFWGSFDLAVTRFSGRRAPEREGVDPVTREAYSHEVTSCGFWPGNRIFRTRPFTRTARRFRRDWRRSRSSCRCRMEHPARRVHFPVRRRAQLYFARSGDSRFLPERIRGRREAGAMGSSQPRTPVTSPA